MPLWLVTIKDKSLDEEQTLGFAVVEAADEKAAHDFGWQKVHEIIDGPRHKTFERLVVGRVEAFEHGKWWRPSVVCNRRHRGPDGEFPG